MPGWSVSRKSAASDQDFVLSGVEPLRRDLPIIERATEMHREKDGLAIWEELRPAVAEFTRLEVREWLGLASSGGNLHQTRRSRPEYDGLIESPGCSGRAPEIAEKSQRGAAANRNLSESCAQKKADPLTIWRKEGTVGAFRVRERRRFQNIHRSQIEPWRFPTPGSNIREPSAIGRKGNHIGLVLYKGCTWRQRYCKTFDWKRLQGSCGAEGPDNCARNGNQDQRPDSLD